MLHIRVASRCSFAQGAASWIQMIIMNDASHFMYREHPDEFIRYVTSFID
jgi:pimeloyl-ACP methyl ester carboxylesterase